MAEELVFKTVIDAANSAQTLGEVKQSIKDINAELNKVPVGSKAFGDLTIALGKSNATVVDLRNQMKALDPEKRFRAVAQIGSSIASGFAAAQGAVALFGGQSEDLTRVLVRVQAAMALTQGLQGLVGLSKALTTARLAMIAFAGPLAPIIAVIAALGVAVVVLAEKFRKSNSETAKMEVAIERLNKISTERKFWMSEEIRLLEAQKGKEEEVIKKKRELIVENLKEVQLSIFLAEAKRKEALEQQNLLDILAGLFSPGFVEARRLQMLTEAQKEIDENKKKLAQLKTDLTISFIDEKELKDKKNEEAVKAEEKRGQDLKTIRDRIADNKRKSDLAGYEADEIFRKQDEAAFLDTINEKLRLKGLEEAKYEELRIKREEREKKIEEFRLFIAQNTFKQIGELALAFAGKSEASQKRAFQINKAAGIAQTTIDTYIAAQKAYASQIIVGDPTSIIRGVIAAGLSVAAGLARVAIIAKTQFNSSSAGGGSSVNTPNLGGGTPNINAPQSQQQAFTTNQTNVNTNEQGNFAGFGNKPIKAVVIETDITDTQSRIRSIEERTTF